MAFNSNTYRANKAKRQAWANMDAARDIKARAAVGNAYDWEVSRISFFVQTARSEMRSHLFWRSFGK